MKKVPRREVVSNTDNVKWEYDVVHENYYEQSESFWNNICSLREAVNLKCQNGWIPEGSISVIEHRGYKYLCQTIVRPITDSNSSKAEVELNQKRQIVRPAYEHLRLSNDLFKTSYDADDGEL